MKTNKPFHVLGFRTAVAAWRRGRKLGYKVKIRPEKWPLRWVWRIELNGQLK